MSELKKIRVFSGKTQFELAQLSGIHPSRISVLERGLTKPSIHEMKRVSEALGVMPEELFGLDAVMNRLTASRKKKTETY
jgi:transcriptional regulator with XRE-family HTH domain